jgi:hypothetical protein
MEQTHYTMFGPSFRPANRGGCRNRHEVFWIRVTCPARSLWPIFRSTVIHFIPLAGGQAHDLTVQGWPGFSSLDFDVDSKGLFVNSKTDGGATILYVDPAGKAHPVWQQKSSYLNWAIPSRDGRRLAMLGQSQSANMWLLDNF